MPRRRRIKLPTRIALPAAELERKMMATLRGLKECAKLKGVRFVDVGSSARSRTGSPIAGAAPHGDRSDCLTVAARAREESLAAGSGLLFD